MNQTLIQAQQAVQNAREALRAGDRKTTRHWAELAASLAPDTEEPWLLLAAVASPQASLGYLKRALQVNPNSPRARKGMEWAMKRLRSAPVDQTQPTRVSKPRTTSPPKKRSRFYPVLLVILVGMVIGAAAWTVTFPPALTGIIDGVVPVATSQPNSFSQADIAKPTYTPTPTLTPSPTPTFTPTPLATDTPVPQPIWTSVPNQAASNPVSEATTSGGTYVVQRGDTLNQIARRFGVSVQALASANNISIMATIYAGQQLVIPGSDYVPSAPPPASGGKRILVDISEQHLYAYQGDTLVYSFVASTGMNNATRAGSFSVLDKIPNAYGATWDLWMPNWLGIYYAGSLENGIHALPILSNGATLWAGYLGTPISYGCVVLGTHEAQLLYNWAEIGTPVDIQW
jgi:LysM repeat protein